METRARRRTSSLPRMTRRRLFSNSAARRAVATRASVAIRGDFTMRGGGIGGYGGHREVLSSRFSVLSKTDHSAWLPVTALRPWGSHNLDWRDLWGALIETWLHGRRP